MAQSIAGVALAAGAGSRMRPVTDTVPKPLCPVATVPLVDHALERLQSIADEVAVNAHHHAGQLISHLGAGVHLSQEVEAPLGTAGGVAHLRSWIDGRAVAVVNGDTWSPGSLSPLLEGWDGESVRVFVPGGGPFGPRSAITGSLMPWRVVRDLQPEPTGLYEVVWRNEHAAGRLELITHHGPWVDCAGPADLLRANLSALAGEAVISPSANVTGHVVNSAISDDATVDGSVSDSVVFPGAHIGAHEMLHGALRWLDGNAVQQTLFPYGTSDVS
jgi:MurNAc alpha-1-phosphate uridylyltransferase